jgi:tol-pal system protein YbgF
VAAEALACVTASEFQHLERRVDAMESGGTLKPGPAGSEGARVAELGAEVAVLEREIAKLKGAVEEASFAASEARDMAEEALREQPTSDASGGQSSSPASAVTPHTQEVQEYDEAFALFGQGRYADAIDRFRGFLQNYPSSDYADNALFWVGECHFKLGDYERAVLSFEDVVKRYPEGNKVPDALYRQGIALLEIGKRTGEEEIYRPAAREIFERIVKQYPSSDRVPEAQRQLEKLAL